MGKLYGYYINMDERGEFHADVRDNSQKTIYELHIGGDDEAETSNPIEDGYMRNKTDIKGLQGYLQEVGLIEKSDKLLSMSDFEKAVEISPADAMRLAEQESIKNQYLSSLRTLYANIQGFVRQNSGTISVAAGLFLPSELRGVAKILQETIEGKPMPGESIDATEHSDTLTFMANLRKAIFDGEPVSIAGGEFKKVELQDLELALRSAVDRLPLPAEIEQAESDENSAPAP